MIYRAINITRSLLTLQPDLPFYIVHMYEKMSIVNKRMDKSFCTSFRFPFFLTCTAICTRISRISFFFYSRSQEEGKGSDCLLVDLSESLASWRQCFS